MLFYDLHLNWIPALIMAVYMDRILAYSLLSDNIHCLESELQKKDKLLMALSL